MSIHNVKDELASTKAGFAASGQLFYVPTWSGHVFRWGETAAPSSYAACSVANTRFLNLYFESTATSGTGRGLYLYLKHTGGATDGEALRAYHVYTTTAGNGVHGAHISLGFSTTGDISGLGVACRATLHVPSATVAYALSGTVAAIQAEIYSDGANSDVDGTASFIRIVNDGNATAMANVEDEVNLFEFSGFTAASGNMIGAAGNEPTWTGKTNLIRCKVGSTAYYLVAITL